MSSPSMLIVIATMLRERRGWTKERHQARHGIHWRGLAQDVLPGDPSYVPLTLVLALRTSH